MIPLNQRRVEPDLCAVLDQLADNIKASLNCISIGTIQTFYPAKQTADIELNYMRVDLYSGKLTAYPMLINCPVIVLGGGSSYLSFPIASGDQCLILFCDREIDTWFTNGYGTFAPASARVHDLNDGIALVGIKNSLSPILNYNKDVASLTDKTGERLNQAGFIQAYAGSTAPSGWLLCDGSSISKATYPVLFAVIGYTYGGGGDSFNVPDLRGNVPVGYKSGDGSFGTIGGTGGEKTHTLTIPEIPSHTHYSRSDTGDSLRGVGSADNDNSNSWETSATGGDGAHNNLQPYITLNYIIKI